MSFSESMIQKQNTWYQAWIKNLKQSLIYLLYYHRGILKLASCLFVIQTPLTKRQPSSQTHAESLKSTKGCLKQQPLSHQPIVIATKQPN